ncbi:MAG: antibiotic biosynthesis monooxygenase [Pseudogulbenkiania sp.]|nr:antibiotic biosynthesis monooxygenase [Pseudogulbenkiania sp.]
MPSSDTTPVTLLITRRVTPSRYHDFMAWTHRGERLAATFAGYLGSGVFVPPPDCDDYQIVFRFTDETSLARWADSSERHDWLQQGADLVHKSQLRYVRGLDNWFGAALAAPPRWKQAVTIWLVFFPVSLAHTLLLGERLSALPVFWRVLCSTLMLTPVMVFVFIPLGTRLLQRWLQPRQDPAPWRNRSPNAG